ncbi:MAG: hypothetical protein HY961_10450 [Ignavibacteriae bacterium]|nr:hypothetical protein [Ignavibacteriota bacterium]
MITREAVATKIASYLQETITLNEIVAWAENAMLDGEFDEASADTLTDVVSRLGIADVRAFGLTWDDCRDFLSRLGYDAHVEVVAL